jgi:Cys-Gly metallodipeptidase DUG1
VYFKVTVSGPGRDLHSGVFGNTVHEVRLHRISVLPTVRNQLAKPMTDLILLLGKLVTPAGEILIPGLSELVAPLTDEER